MQKVSVNENCIGCGACASITEDIVFKINDQGYAEVTSNNTIDEMNDDLKERVMDAKEGCPVAAIEITEKDA